MSPPALPILICIDDEDGPRQSLKLVFGKQFEVHGFSGGTEAVAFVQAHAKTAQPVMVAILDIRMAGESGVEVLAGIKIADSRVEVIMLTAYETVDTARAAIRLGACDYLSKPFQLGQIRDAVTRAMRLRNVANAAGDMTERIKALTLRLNSAEQGEDYAKTLAEIYASAIHDINNALQIVRGFCDMLQDRLSSRKVLQGDELRAAQAELAHISTSTQVSESITLRYLQLGRREKDTVAHISVNNVLQEVQSFASNLPGTRGKIIEVVPLPIDCMMQIETIELTQILLNLAINGAHASRSGQRILIQAESRVTAFSERELLDMGSMQKTVGLELFDNRPPFVRFTVSDSGVGMPPEVLSRIFEPFYTTKKSNSGTGLGLAIVARFTTERRGLIAVTSVPGKGTSFAVTLPVQF